MAAGDVPWLLETKGQETVDLPHKDVAVLRWCANATHLSGKGWRYVKLSQKHSRALQPARLADLMAFRPAPLL